MVIGCNQEMYAEHISLSRVFLLFVHGGLREKVFSSLVCYWGVNANLLNFEHEGAMYWPVNFMRINFRLLSH